MQENKKKTVNAVVVSKSGDKTVKVRIDYKVKHPQYGKYIRRRTNLSVHDARNEAAVGDKVEVAECRPQSKAKNWRLVRVVAKAVAE